MSMPAAPTSTPPPVGTDARVDRRIKRVTKQDRRGLVYIIGIAVAFHLMVGYFLFIPAKDVLPKVRHFTEEIKPNFQAGLVESVDSATGESLIEQQYTIDLQGKVPGLDPQPVRPPGAASPASAPPPNAALQLPAPETKPDLLPRSNLGVEADPNTKTVP